jgi:hypothetical protein
MSRKAADEAALGFDLAGPPASTCAAGRNRRAGFWLSSMCAEAGWINVNGGKDLWMNVNGVGKRGRWINVSALQCVTDDTGIDRLPFLDANSLVRSPH